MPDMTAAASAFDISAGVSSAVAVEWGIESQNRADMTPGKQRGRQRR